MITVTNSLKNARINTNKYANRKTEQKLTKTELLNKCKFPNEILIFFTVNSVKIRENMKNKDIILPIQSQVYLLVLL
jgi:hypothetical protein